MTTDTSREAVEAVIKRLCNMGNDSDWNFYGKPAVDVLAALLYERDRLAANRDAWVSDAMTSTTELEQRIRDLEADLAGARGVRDRERARAERAEQRIRDLEAEKIVYESVIERVRNWAAPENRAGYNAPWAYLDAILNSVPYEVAQDIVKMGRRLGIAEAERDAYKRAKAENDERFQIEAAEQRERADRLAAKLDAVKAFIANRSVIGGMDRMRLAAILADTSGCWWEFEDGDRKFLPHERADNGACANCFAILADTDALGGGSSNEGRRDGE